MAEVHPFRALTYDQAVAGDLGDLVSPPYDVIDEQQREALLARSTHNAVRLILPTVEYAQVADLIAEWRRAGVLRRAARPLMIGWSQTFRLPDGSEHTRNSIVAAVGVEPYEARVIRPHERTHAGPKEDRLRLTRAVQTNLSPVFGLYPDPDGVVWQAAGSAQAPKGELTDPEGTTHRVWPITHPAACAAVTAAMAERWILIADGHHRYEPALAYRDERRAAESPSGPMPYDRVMMGLTSLHDPGLLVLPTHRILNRPIGGDLLGAFEVTPIEDIAQLERALLESPQERPALGLVRGDDAALLTCDLPPDASPADSLDVGVLERELLIAGLGDDQATLAHDGVLSYTKDATEAWSLVRNGTATAAIVMRPMPKDAVAAVADAGETMPQKSTYFFPKLLTGVAFNPLTDE